MAMFMKKTSVIGPFAQKAQQALGAGLVPTGRVRLSWSGLWLGLLAVLLSLLIGVLLWLSQTYESRLGQLKLEQATRQAVSTLRAHLLDSERSLRLLADRTPGMTAQGAFETLATDLLRADQALLRLELRTSAGLLVSSLDALPPKPQMSASSRLRQNFEGAVALRSAVEFERTVYARPYYVQITSDSGFELLEMVVPLRKNTQEVMALIAVYSMPRLLAYQLPAAFVASHEIFATESDGTLIARAGEVLRVSQWQQTSQALDLPGSSMLIRARTEVLPLAWVPSLLSTSLVVLGLGLLACGWALWRHLQFRAQAEQALFEQYAFRKAMEDSLVTGLRARDLAGKTTYVNPAFCEMTGYSEQELIGQSPPMPYWIAERREEHERRLAQIMAGQVTRAGYESEFQRKSGERFVVLIFEAPLINAQGEQTGWLSSMVDVTEIRRIESVNRKQLEQIQANARLLMLGEMATAMAHELNQPLGAITSYAAACENLLASNQTAPLHSALVSMRQQSERAAQVIRSVQAFVKRREVEHSPVAVDALVRRILPLIQLQAKRIQATVRLDLGKATVSGDETLLEQVVLNLTRNAVDAMAPIAHSRRILSISLHTTDSHCELVVTDRGEGLSEMARQRLFTPFFTTKAEGLGVGLSFCRSVIEQLQGHLEHRPFEPQGSQFVIVLPLAVQAGDLAAPSRPVAAISN
jgi:two-component system, LuxR family, sensor histidine kinase DctS